MTRKPLLHSPTKDKLLDAAQALVLGKGFSATSVDDVCKAAKLTKGSFFHYFKSKDILGAELLKRYCASSKEAFSSGCCCQEKDPLKRVYGFLDFIIERGKKNNGKGCLLGSMAQELSDSHPQIRSICCDGFDGMTQMMTRELKEAKAKYAPKDEAIDPESLAEHFVVVLQGSLLVSRAKKGSGVRASGVKHYKQYLQTLFGR